ncbi:TlyA family RNA methyltransferase [Fulvimarina sp. 2208YS6-2-32]|uniref:TlyA family RNA methyltransferase n=1 Tax=Fulvimarina uroteuthidis TaxID=3098149 RepID=A0ABU5HZK1_9HYPH|nr:TlyA family RNA methyltransferase [Fulvimarina sp. 2208YS6-2-32]MDY8108555.1 TlyA family RNA methyltransferase [Fulvimarina sp. 2208YS6-2-32]
MTDIDSPTTADDDDHAAESQRLDQALVERGLMPSRSRALDAVRRGSVTVDGKAARKASQPVAARATITVDDPASDYVSRAALKLIAGLDQFGVAVKGRVCLDIGASTGGFSQVLLERGAGHVIAIDVGHEQLHPSLHDEERLTNIEGLNARDLTADDLDGEAPDLVVADVSFISLKLALPPALALAAPGARLVALVKPQFEAGKQAIGKGGLLKDPATAEAVARDVADWLGEQPGWRVDGLIASPISGGDGNREFVLAATKTGAAA